MSNYKFDQIKEKVLTWYKKIASNNSNEELIIELSKNSSKTLIIDLTFRYCMAQMIVNETDFAPYKLFSFEAMTIDSKKSVKSGQPELIYFFYDSIETREDELMEEIDIAFEYCLSYIPNELSDNYIGKKGYLNLKNNQSKVAIHPDDTNKLNSAMLKECFICMDTQFQYLIVKNDNITIRILPIIFDVKKP